MLRRVWTFSNMLSISRVVLIAPIWYCLVVEFPHHRLWAAAVMVVAVGTDFLDGYLARTLHEVSDAGKIIDPLADKIGVATVGIILAWTGDLPIWFVVSALVRDFLIVAGGVYIKRKKNIVAQSNWPGKITVSMMAMYLFLSTLRLESLESFRAIVLWSSVLLMVFSLALYAQRLFIGPKTLRVS